MGIGACPLGLSYMKNGKPMGIDVSSMGINASPMGMDISPMGLFCIGTNEPMDCDMVPWA
jgi:hypothetical protein